MEAVVRRGTIILPKRVLEALGLSDGDILEVKVEGDKIVLKPFADPFRVLEEVLGDFEYSRKERKKAEEYLLEVAV